MNHNRATALFLAAVVWLGLMAAHAGDQPRFTPGSLRPPQASVRPPEQPRQVAEGASALDLPTTPPPKPLGQPASPGTTLSRTSVPGSSAALPPPSRPSPRQPAPPKQPRVVPLLPAAPAESTHVGQSIPAPAPMPPPVARPVHQPEPAVAEPIYAPPVSTVHAEPAREAPVRRYDPLPRRMADMDQYERIAMEPYGKTYDSLAIDRQAELYARQFNLMRNRKPVFHPDTIAAIRRARSEAAREAESKDERSGFRLRMPSIFRRGSDKEDEPAAMPREQPRPYAEAVGPPPRQDETGTRFYDYLPRTLAEMDQYDRIAMSPFPDYDYLSTQEKAEIYSRQFEQMRGRKPVFAPGTLGKFDGARSIHEANRAMYKEPPKIEAKGRKDVNLDTIPGPWSGDQATHMDQTGGHAEPQSYVIRPDGSVVFQDDRDTRMESLRGMDLRHSIKGR